MNGETEGKKRNGWRADRQTANELIKLYECSRFLKLIHFNQAADVSYANYNQMKANTYKPQKTRTNKHQMIGRMI